ncbi:heat-inducible transcriptional repressor HrcA [[Mycoplasma] testudinis]|uniref:heat-inducible transcriptional repressor HrcA n=1 Tax=[Mycoplasma] testudinis TaxID=33924 RepID=UPI000485274B|nr:heat-inducible transcriptional repressor HrcA [[Mycoplasma] testudinis]
MELTKRQSKLIKAIIDEYTATAAPVGSKLLMSKYFKDLSSATIRNEMLQLEKLDLVEKTHTSSGRVPSLKGYHYYEKNLLSPIVDDEIRTKLRKILSARVNSIDEVIEVSVDFINQITNLPTVITSFKTDDRLCRLDLVKLNDTNGLVLVVSSSGNVIKKTVQFGSENQFVDVATCIKVFNDRLVDTKFSEIQSKLGALKVIIKKMVHQYEYIVQEIVNRIFEFNENNQTNVRGTKNLIAQPEFADRDKLLKIMNLLENTSVWQQISYNHQKTGKTVITFGDSLGVEGVSVASTMIETDNKKHQIAVVGPTRMNYEKIKGLLILLKEEIEKIGRHNVKTENHIETNN